MDNVKGKRLVITGGAMGMGKIYARLAVEGGAADVVLWDINEQALKETAAELEGRGTTLHTAVVDVSDQKAVQDAAVTVLSEVGTPHVVFNNAGIVRGNSYFWETAEDCSDAKLTVDINTMAPMYLSRALLPAMITAGEEARIVNIASAAGLVSNPRMASYAASKWAAVGFSDSLRLELEQAGHDFLKVTTVCPFYIKTGMFDGAKPAGPLFPLLEPEDVCSDVWKAMLKGTPMLILPKTVVLNETMKGLLPTRARDFLSRLMGVHDSMEEFTGRR